MRRVEANPTSDKIAMYRGFSANQYQLIGDMLVRPSRSIMYDWSHCYLQDGIGDAEFGTLMATCSDIATYSELAEFAALFAPPRAFTSLGPLFEPNKLRNALKDAKFQCDCSEFCTLAPIASRYLREVARMRAVGEGGFTSGRGGDARMGGALVGFTRVRQVVHTRADRPSVRSMLACFDVMEMLSAARNVGTVRPSELAAAIRRHLDAFVLHERPAAPAISSNSASIARIKRSEHARDKLSERCWHLRNSPPPPIRHQTYTLHGEH